MFVTEASNQPTGAANLKSGWCVRDLAQVTQRNGHTGGAPLLQSGDSGREKGSQMQGKLTVSAFWQHDWL
jgi:hypothetical protein